MRYFILIFTLLASSRMNAQWSLAQCIEYGTSHHSSIAQAKITKAFSDLTLKDNQYAIYPSVNVGFDNGLSVGRSIDPTSNQFVSQGYYFNGWNVNASWLAFGWGGNRYRIAQSQNEVQANESQIHALQNDLALNIAAAYLRVLNAKEQIRINQTFIQNTNNQLANTQARVKSGALAELALLQVQTQLSIDSANYLSSILDEQAALLDLKMMMQLPPKEPLDIQPISNLVVNENLLFDYLSAESIYEQALKTRPQQVVARYRISAAQCGLKLAQSALLPSVSIGANLGTNYASTLREVTEFTVIGEEVIGKIKVGDSSINVTRPKYDFRTRIKPFFNQYGDNFRQTWGVNINAPIFNGYSAKNNITRAKLNIQSQELSAEMDRLKLEQDIYKAYNDAQSAKQRLSVSKNSVRLAELTLEAAQKRYNAGLLPLQELLTQQITVQRLKIQELLAQYDALFKVKVLDFYAGKKISL